MLQYVNDSTPQLLRHLFQETCDKLGAHYKIYTDGSRINEKTGAAVILPETSLTFRLQNTSNVYTAETLALLKALEHLHESHQENKTITI